MTAKLKSDDFEINFYEGVLRRNPKYVDALGPLAEAYTRGGQYLKGLEIDKRLSRLRKDDPIVHYNLACSYALVGRKKDSLLALKRAIRLGYRDFGHMKRDADLKILHGDPAFEKLFKPG